MKLGEALSGIAPAQASDPVVSGPIEIVVPFAPGAGTDAIARKIAPELSRLLDTPVFVSNKSGVAANIGTEHVTRAKPDGRTLLLAGNWVSVNQHLFRNMRFDPVTDLEHVALLARQPLVLVVNPALKATTLKELIELARSTPGALTYASAGAGNQTHLMAELFKRATGTDMLHVPFNGGGNALTAVMAGHVSLMFLGPSPTAQLVVSGKLRALAVTGVRRSTMRPDVPTLDEAGLSVREFDNGSWWGISAPAQTPKVIVNRLNGALSAALKDPKLRESLVSTGFLPEGGTPQEFDQLVRSEAALGQR